MPESTSDNISTTETLISVDAAPIEALSRGKIDKRSFSSPTPDTSASSHEHKPAEGGSYVLSHKRFVTDISEC